MQVVQLLLLQMLLTALLKAKMEFLPLKPLLSLTSFLASSLSFSPHSSDFTHIYSPCHYFMSLF